MHPLSDLATRPSDHAIFLDIDGTLIDLAPTPEGVEIPPDLTEMLRRLSDRMGGALALVTGRRIDWADGRFGHAFPMAGLHGFERRRADGGMQMVEVPPGLDLARARLAHFADIPGMVVEDKAAALTLHYRGAPDRQAEAEAAMEVVAREVGDAWTLQRGKMMIELRPSGASKGAALTAFLSEAPFKGRRPIAIGDDVTDEAMFPIASAAGGIGIRVGDPEQPTAAKAHLPSPEALRDILRGIAWAG
ncbi:trehalose-phosphatase [Falsirhodobacter xinxiangensis]|uniref:trehalose-phosphatase n=1 Tax=Falsirhodobacter xinxiangensis TaxID=2530049 RepID=UPI0010AA6DEE|nr:trehalose-phosphatase [Rhodobacter xinxiangensis]